MECHELDKIRVILTQLFGSVQKNQTFPSVHPPSLKTQRSLISCSLSRARDHQSLTKQTTRFEQLIPRDSASLDADAFPDTNLEGVKNRPAVERK